MNLIDSHCHIQFKDYPGPHKVVTAAAQANVTKLVCVGTTLADSQAAIDLAAKFKTVWASVGAHPHEATSYLNDKHAEARFKKLLAQPKVVAVGEIGLDFYKNHSSQIDQTQALKQQLGATIDSGLPYIFHVRDAWSEFWQILDAHQPGGQPLRGVVHSFSAHPGQLDQVLSRGLYVGLNGIMTFTNDPLQLEAARQVPLDRLVLETDAPFLTPKPHRGDLCEPRHIADIAQFLARLRGESVEELATATTKNAETLFGL
ncbi:TatD family hydrolase [Candidatus Saccharibacteria bacterium]|nr:TatD family hydrolase [Candidatus Saccharibacteria bacterium]